MDAITAAVALIGQQAEISKMDLAARMVRQNSENQQGLIELIASSADSGSLYSAKAGAVQAVSTGQQLNTTA